MVVQETSATFPAIRALMGDWVYYVTTVRFRDVAERVSPAKEIHPNELLREWIQRKLTPRADTIAKYLVSQPQRFFNAIILGIYDGRPEWFPVEIGDSKTLGKSQLPARASESIGLLRLHGGEKIFAIDGQHRVEAIKLAISKNPDLGEEDQCAIFVAHDKSEQGRVRTRRLFSTLNRYAKPVSKGEIVALDEDDAFAIVTRRLVEEYQPLTGARVSYANQRQISPGEKVAITTILALSEMVQTISLPTKASSKVKEDLTRFRPPDAKLDQLYKLQVAFWDALRRHFPEIKEATEADASARAAGRYRTSQGGHLLFRPIAQKTFAAAVRVLMDRAKTKNAEQTVKTAVGKLGSLPMRLSDAAWVHVFWDPIKANVIRPKPALALNLMLHLVGSATFPEDYDLLSEYRSALKNENAKLPILK